MVEMEFLGASSQNLHRRPTLPARRPPVPAGTAGLTIQQHGQEAFLCPLLYSLRCDLGKHAIKNRCNGLPAPARLRLSECCLCPSHQAIAAPLLPTPPLAAPGLAVHARKLSAANSTTPASLAELLQTTPDFSGYATAAEKLGLMQVRWRVSQERRSMVPLGE